MITQSLGEQKQSKSMRTNLLYILVYSCIHITRIYTNTIIMKDTQLRIHTNKQTSLYT